MSEENVPIEIQEEIMKRLPVKSLIQFRSVSKAWKSLIDSPDFIAGYSGQQQQHLLVRYDDDSADFVQKYVLIADDDTFPHHKVFPTIHHLVKMLKYYTIVGCSHGLLCLYGGYQKGPRAGPISGTGTAVVWNISIRKAFAVVVPNVADEIIFETVLGFGICCKTTDPKIVKITQIRSRSAMECMTSIPRHVEVYTLSTGAWRSPYTSNLPRKSLLLDDYNVVVIDGVLYWLATDRITMEDGFQSYILLLSFDMTNEEFREVDLPDSLAHQSIRNLSIYKLRESLVVLEVHVEANNLVFNVWMMEDGVPKSFTKLLTVNPPDAIKVCVMGFRKTGELIIDSPPDYPESFGSLSAYEPHSKSINNLGINGSVIPNVVYSYIETLLLL